MITKFQKETVIPIVVNTLLNHVGKKNAITSHTIIYYLEDVHSIVINGLVFRELIHYIRVNGLVKSLLASPCGYYIATSKKETEHYLETLKGRIESIQEVYNSFTERSAAHEK